MQRLSTITARLVGALTVFVIAFAVPFDAAAQQPRLVLPSSNVQNLPGNLPVMADPIADSLRAAMQAVPSQRAGKSSRASGAGWAGLAGFIVGGITGSWLEKTLFPCACDDPGLRGGIIGATGGAMTFGILAAR